jgi:hypothetical protein
MPSRSAIDWSTEVVSSIALLDLVRVTDLGPATPRPLTSALKRAQSACEQIACIRVDPHASTSPLETWTSPAIDVQG